jgi:hypothetical protein
MRHAALKMRVVLWLLSVAVGLLSQGVRAEGGAAEGGGRCEAALQRQDPAPFFGTHAPCASQRSAYCAHLDKLGREAFDRLADRVKSEDAAPNRARSGITTRAALSACGLDYDTLLARQCRAAYRQIDQGFLLRHCPAEAWSLGRAECERTPDTISPDFKDYCWYFNNGKAPLLK